MPQAQTALSSIQAHLTGYTLDTLLMKVMKMNENKTYSCMKCVSSSLDYLLLDIKDNVLFIVVFPRCLTWIVSPVALFKPLYVNRCPTNIKEMNDLRNISKDHASLLIYPTPYYSWMQNWQWSLDSASPLLHKEWVPQKNNLTPLLSFFKMSCNIIYFCHGNISKLISLICWYEHRKKSINIHQVVNRLPLREHETFTC